MSNNPMSIINDVTAKAQANVSYKEAYLSNPTQVLKDAGLEIPDGITVHVIAGNPSNSSIPNSTSSDVYLVYPEVDESIKDESLATAASASCTSTSSSCFCIPSTVSCASTASTNSCS